MGTPILKTLGYKLGYGCPYTVDGDVGLEFDRS